MELNLIRQWGTPSKIVLLESDQVHVWRIELTHLIQAPSSRYAHVLSIDEISKANKFFFEGDRTKYMITRLTVREILGSYLEVEPEELVFAYNQYGKPYLAKQGHEESLNFNISHAGNLSLLAITKDRRIGVDLEPLRDEASMETIAKRFFAPAEVTQLLSFPDDLRQKAFFTCWTRKEAFVKAQGKGLSIPLDQFEVAFGPNEIPRLIKTSIDGGETDRWSIFHLDPGPGYVGALVVEGSGLNVIGLDWPGQH